MIDDGDRAAVGFFSRLENETDFTDKFVFFLCQRGRDGKAHRRMRVMSAGMNGCFIAGDIVLIKRTVACSVRLVIRQTVDVKSERSNRTGPSAVKFSDNTGNSLCLFDELRIRALRNGAFLARSDLRFGRADQRNDTVNIGDVRSHEAGISHRGQDFRDSGTCADFAPAVFRIFVKFAAVFDKLIHKKSPFSVSCVLFSCIHISKASPRIRTASRISSSSHLEKARRICPHP